MKFADLGLSDELLKAIGDAGYDEPTPIQAQSIPPVLMMKDLIGIAQTGTGKTASFVLPMIDILSHGRARARMPRSLILEPTRELAAQVAENFEKYGKYTNLSMALLIGGVSMGDQIKALEKGVDVLIATPGRLMDLFERGRILLNGCDLLVIDEADRMLDMGFIPDIETICTKLPATRQTMLFSATMPPPIKKLADKFLDNPKYIEVARPATANKNIEQFISHVAANKKRDLLHDLLKSEKVETGIIFCNRKTTVRDLNKALKRSGFATGEIHGDIDQAARQAELEAFKNGDINLLVASDVAARGLDIKGVSHVFNFDAPWHPDDYVHRIGRTGRAGAKGKAFTFVTRADEEALDNIQKLVGYKIDVHGAKGGSGKKAGSSDSADDARGNDDARGDDDKPAPKKSRGRKSESDRSSTRDKPRNSRRNNRGEARDERQDEKPAQKRSDSGSNQPEKASPKKHRDDAGKNSGDDAADKGEWNGPVPDFLGASFKD